MLLIIMAILIVILSVRNLVLCLIALVCFFSNCVLAYVHRYIRPLGASADEAMFESLALEWSSSGFWHAISSVDVAQSHIFSSFAALLFSIFGYEPILVNYFGGFLGALIVIYSYRLAFCLTSNKAISIAIAIFTALLPSLHIISILFLRDIYVIFFILAGFYHYSVWRKRRDIISLLVATFLFVVGGLFHTAVLATLFFIFMLEAFCRSAGLARSLVSGKATITGIAFSLFVPLLLASIITGWALGVGASKVNQAVKLFQGDERALQRLSGEIIKTDAEVIIYPAPSSANMLGIVMNVPERFVYILAAPFPWMYQKITDIPRVFDSLAVFVLVVYFLFNFNFFRARYHLFIPIVAIALSYVIFALGTFDVLTGSRHRLKYIVPLSVFIASGMFLKYQSKFSSKSKN